jgi:hypothetical protein
MLAAHSQVCGLPTASMAISTPRPCGEGAHLGDGIVMVAAGDQIVGAQGGGAIELRLAAADGDHAAAVELGQLHEHQADGPQADDRDGVAGLRGGLFEAADHAGQRFHQCGILIAHMLGDDVGVALDDARGMRMYSA